MVFDGDAVSGRDGSTDKGSTVPTWDTLQGGGWARTKSRLVEYLHKYKNCILFSNKKLAKID